VYPFFFEGFHFPVPLKVPGRIHHLTSQTQLSVISLKDWAFGKCLATSLGRYLKSYGRPIILDMNGFSALCLKIICDTDIQGQENREVFIDNWKHWGESTKLIPRLEIKPYIESIEFETEQEQNLLLLPDYLAGYVHYYSDPSRIAPPVNVSKQGLDNFGQALSRFIKFELIEYAFDETFPNLTRRFTAQ